MRQLKFIILLLISVFLFFSISSISYSVGYKIGLKSEEGDKIIKLPTKILPLTLFTVVVEIGVAETTDKVYAAEFHLEFDSRYFDVVDKNLATVNQLTPLAPFDKNILLNTITKKDENTKIINYSATADIESPPTGKKEYPFVKFYLMGKKGTGTKDKTKLVFPNLSADECAKQKVCSAVVIEHKDGNIVVYGYGSTKNRLNFDKTAYELIINPLPPINLQATTIIDNKPSNNRVKLSWQSAGDSGRKYNVYYYAQAAGAPTPTDKDYKTVFGCTKLDKLECIDSKIIWDEAGKKYWYKVAAIDDGGNEGRKSVTPVTVMDKHPPQNIKVSAIGVYGDPTGKAIITATVDEPAKIEVEWELKKVDGTIIKDKITSGLDKSPPSYTPSVTIEKNENLKPGTTIHCHVKVIDATGGKEHESCYNPGGTLTCPGEKIKVEIPLRDPPRPNLRDITATPTCTPDGCTMTIVWKTVDAEGNPLPADSKVEYGKTTAYGEVVYDTAMVADHSITIPATGYLEKDVKYNYRVCSNSKPGDDAKNNCSTNKEFILSPPKITHTPVTTAPPNKDLPITATITGGLAKITAKVVYSREGPTWDVLPETSIDMVKKTGDTYEATIPATVTAPPALYYCIQVDDGISATQYSPTNWKTPHKVGFGVGVELNVSHSPVTSGAVGKPLCMSCNVTGGTPPYDAEIRYGKTSALGVKASMTTTDGSYFTGCIPEGDVTGETLYYQIYVEDSSSPIKTAYAPRNPQLVTLVGVGKVGRIRGIVKEVKPDGTTQPLAGAKVTILGPGLSTLTAADGGYLFDNVKAGIYTVKVEKVGYTTDRKDNVVVQENQTTEVNFELTQPASVRGFCYNVKDNSPIHNITLFAVNTDTNYKYPPITTAEDGSFKFTDLKPGNYKIYVDGASALSLRYREPDEKVVNDDDGPWIGKLSAGENPNIEIIFKLTPLSITQVVINPLDVVLRLDGLDNVRTFEVNAKAIVGKILKEIKVSSVKWQLTNPEIGKLEAIPGTNIVRFKAIKPGESELIVTEINDENITRDKIVKNNTRNTRGAYIRVSDSMIVIGPENPTRPFQPSIRSLEQGRESSQIKYKVSQIPIETKIEIYNLRGRLIRRIVRTGYEVCDTGGSCKIDWDYKDELGRIVNNGIYVIKITVISANGEKVTIKPQPIGVFKRE